MFRNTHHQWWGARNATPLSKLNYRTASDSHHSATVMRTINCESLLDAGFGGIGRHIEKSWRRGNVLQTFPIKQAWSLNTVIVDD